MACMVHIFHQKLRGENERLKIDDTSLANVSFPDASSLVSVLRRHRRAGSAGAKFGNQNGDSNALTRHPPARPGGAMFAWRADYNPNIAPAGQARR